VAYKRLRKLVDDLEIHSTSSQAITTAVRRFREAFSDFAYLPARAATHTRRRLSADPSRGAHSAHTLVAARVKCKEPTIQT
jgi:hypothetical protein